MQTAGWNQFVAASPQGDVMQCLEWGAVKQPEWQPVPLAVEQDGQLRTVSLLLRRPLPRTGRCILYAPRGPIVDWDHPALLEEWHRQVRATARREKAILVKVDPAVPAGHPHAVQELMRLGFCSSPDASTSFGGTQPRCVMKLDLSGTLEKVQQRFHPKWRYNIRLAERKGVRVVQSTSACDLAIFHRLYAITGERNRFRGRPLSYFQKLWKQLVEPGLAALFLTYHDDQPLSGALCFLLPPQCWYVYGASSNQQRNLMPNHLMQWTMIQWAHQQGCRVYDFRGVHDPQRQVGGEDGLVRFKAGFGAEMVEYIGEWDLPLSRGWYVAWTVLRPKIMAAVGRLRRG